MKVYLIKEGGGQCEHGEPFTIVKGFFSKENAMKHLDKLILSWEHRDSYFEIEEVEVDE